MHGLWCHLASTGENCWQKFFNAWTGICNLFCSRDLDPTIFIYKPDPKDILDVQIWTSYLEDFERNRLTDRQTDTTKIIYDDASRVVNNDDDWQWRLRPKQLIVSCLERAVSSARSTKRPSSPTVAILSSPWLATAVQGQLRTEPMSNWWTLPKLWCSVTVYTVNNT